MDQPQNGRQPRAHDQGAGHSHSRPSCSAAVPVASKRSWQVDPAACGLPGLDDRSASGKRAVLAILGDIPGNSREHITRNGGGSLDAAQNASRMRLGRLLKGPDQCPSRRSTSTVRHRIS